MASTPDYLLEGQRLPGPGETLQGEVFQEAVGGRGANQAVAVVRFGGREEQFLPRFPVASIDATGAGDAFAGGLAASLAEERPLIAAAVLAGAAAALVTTKLGAQAGLPRRAEVMRFLAESQHEHGSSRRETIHVQRE